MPACWASPQNTSYSKRADALTLLDPLTLSPAWSGAFFEAAITRSLANAAIAASRDRDPLDRAQPLRAFGVAGRGDVLEAGGMGDEKRHRRLPRGQKTRTETVLS
jgi:hypothetical protein